jgi:hypothetical protein
MSYSLKEIIEDLEYVLFSQNSFVPWIDKKYGKRILRISILYVLQKYYKEINKREEIMELIELFDNIKKFVDERKDVRNYVITANDISIYVSFVEPFILYNSTNTCLVTIFNSIFVNENYEYYDIHQVINIKPKYKILRTLIETAIMWGFLHFKDTIFINNFINYYRKKYLWVPVDLTDNTELNKYKSNFYNLINELAVNIGIMFFAVEENQVLIGGNNNKNINTNLKTYKFKKLM